MRYFLFHILPRSHVIMFVKVFVTFFIALTLFEVNAFPRNSEGNSPATGFEGKLEIIPIYA